MGMTDETSALLRRLERAVGLAALTTATMGSGPCGSCPESYTDCQSIEEFRADREAGLAQLSDAGAGGGAAGAEGGAAGAPDGTPPSLAAQYAAIAESWDGVSCPTSGQRDAILQITPGNEGRYWGNGDPTASTEPGICCYRITPKCGEGRPFLIDGAARVAELLPSEQGSDEGGSASDARALLSEAWLRDALMEHASIAAFARLTLQLLAHAAPAELVSASQRASLDELRHAEFCFAKASQYAGRTLRPGPLSVTGALDDTSLAALIESNLYEGCIGETLAALRLKRQAEEVSDPELKAALLAISEDEASHAELAFRILAFCRERAPELTQQAVLRALNANFLDRDTPSHPSAVQEGALYLSERLSAAAAAASDRSAWTSLLRPLFLRFISEAESGKVERCDFVGS